MSRFTYYHLNAGPSNVYDGHYSDSDYYFINETAINASGTRPVHRLSMTLSKAIGGSTLWYKVNITNLETHVFNGFALVFIVENGLVDPAYPTITWNSVFRDYGLNMTLSLAGSSNITFNGAWAIPSSDNASNIQVIAGAYDSDSRDPTYGWPYAVQSIGASIVGDLTGPTPGVPDGKVDIRDVAYVAKAFGSTPGMPGWNWNCDINNDGIVNIKDIAIVAKHFGESSP